jgi:hypothetical protein
MSRKFGVIPLSLLVLAACGDGATDPTDSSPTLDADVANAVADGVGEDVSTMRELNFGLRTGGLFFPIGHVAGANCPWNSATGWHECQARDAGPLTIERQYAFYNAAGTAQETYDDDQTASIRVKRVVDGSMDRGTDRGSISGTVHHARDLTVSGLQGTETKRTWNGTGHSEIAHTHVNDDHGSRSYEMTADIMVADVVVPHAQDTDRDPWPLSGAITTHVVGSVTRDGEARNFERTVVITFDGTQFAKAVVNGTGGSGEFTIDLANRRLGHRP